MSHDAGEVSWQTLRRIVHEWSGDQAEIEQVSSLDGGSISTTILIVTKSGDRAVLKLSPHRVDPTYEREAHQLDLLRELGLPAPRVFGFHVGTLDRPDSYLLIEHMSGANLHDVRKEASADDFDDLQRQLAEFVVAIHCRTGARYGRIETVAKNGGNLAAAGGTNGHATWPQFFRSLYDTIWHECEKHAALPAKSRRTIGKIHARLDDLIAHGDRPRLTHGDLWWSNVLADRDTGGRWRITGILDPNCKYAHAESELAYLELFQTTTPAFIKTYQQTFKLGEEYHRVRKAVYQLYELINHVNLFGERYLKPMQATLDKVAPLV
jgi:fructosamine-3-kinase